MSLERITDPPRPPAVRKRVLIDATPVTNSVDGLSIYIVNLIKGLPSTDISEFEFTILLNPGINWPDLESAMTSAGFNDLRATIAPIGPRREWDMYRFLQKHQSRYDLIHIPSNNYPAALRGGVCTIHDMTYLRWFDRKGRIPGWRWAARRFLRTLVSMALRRADAIVAVSNATRDTLVAEFGRTTKQDITVIYEGWEHLKAYPESDSSPVSLEQSRYILFLGSNRVHKNLSNLLKAFELASNRIPDSVSLVISGLKRIMPAEDQAVLRRVNEQRERIIFTGYITNGEVRQMYENADAFIFPSLSEGFGLPVLEAFYFGAPLLCSSTTSLPEIAGNAALYFDPADPNSIANCIATFYSDPDVAPRLRAAGKVRIESFSWNKAACETVALYRRLLTPHATQ